jgi:flagellin-specific chaperone FliS
LVVLLSIGIYKLVDKLLNKDVNVGKDGIGFNDGNNKKNKNNNNDDLEKQIEQPALFISSTQELTGLINLIIDLPDIAIKKNESLHFLKEQLITEQIQDFKARLKSYRVDIRKEYQELLGIEDFHDNRVRLFAYWFSDLFEDVDDEIMVILKLNGLNEKTADQLEDTLTRLYDTTFSKIIEATDLAPKFIEQPAEVRKILERTKSKYREALQSSLNHAKKLRIEYQGKFDRINEEYSANRDLIIARDFPNIDIGVIKEKC